MPAPPRSLIGRTLGGDYVIERKIGDGGMGDVYAARHTRLPQLVAIKVLHRELGQSEELFLRFKHEAEVLAALRHPHIVQVTDFNRLPDGTIYLVMEYLEGESLQARLSRRGRLPLPEVLIIARQVGSALTAAHKHGVVHRDLKPQNLFLALLDHGDRLVEQVKVLDFGVSKIRRDGEEDLTRVGRILGTPQFMSPEQARGQSHLIDGRADQFALGAILYYALSGQLPFTGSEPSAVIYQVLYETPPPLQDFAPMPGALVDAVGRALAKHPEERFPSIGEFLRAVEVAAEGTVLSPPAANRPRTRSLPGVTPQHTPQDRTPPVHAPPVDPTVLTTPSVKNVPEAKDSATVLRLTTTLSGSSGAVSVRGPGPRRAVLGAFLLCGAAIAGGVLSRPRDPRGRSGDLAGDGPRSSKSEIERASRELRGPSPPAPRGEGRSGEPDLRALLAKGAERFRADDIPGARRAYEEALRIDPHSSTAMSGIGEIEMEQRNYSAALRWLREAAAREPDLPRHHLLLCQVRFRLGEISGAQKSCARVLQLDPDSSDARLMLRSMRR